MSDVAVIGGTGHQGLGLALRWAAAGLDVTIGSRDAGRAADAANTVRSRLAGLRPEARVRGAENATAATAAPIVVLAVPLTAQVETLRGLKGHLPDDALLVDVTVPLAAPLGV